MYPSVKMVKVWEFGVRELVSRMASQGQLLDCNVPPDALAYEVQPGPDGTGVLIIRSEEEVIDDV